MSLDGKFIGPNEPEGVFEDMFVKYLKSESKTISQFWAIKQSIVYDLTNLLCSYDSFDWGGEERANKVKQIISDKVIIEHIVDDFIDKIMLERFPDEVDKKDEEEHGYRMALIQPWHFPGR